MSITQQMVGEIHLETTTLKTSQKSNLKTFPIQSALLNHYLDEDWFGINKS